MGWLIATILVVVLILARSRLREAERAALHFARRRLDVGAGPELSYSEVLDLVVLRLEIDRLRDSGALGEERHCELHEATDALWSERLLALEAQPETEAWRTRRTRAWALLMRRGLVADGPLPWAEAEAAAAAPPAAGLPVQIATTAVEPELRPDPVPTPALRALAELPLAPSPDGATSALATPSPEPSGNLAGATAPSRSDAISHYAWQAAEPGLLERTLKVVSGWHAVLAPFLVQNIGWFIGGFCFLAGSIFLVANTTGFAKALAIFGALAAYTLLLLHGGYQLRRRRPELSTSSQVLVSLGALLVPLTIAAATRLLTTAAPSYGLVAGALLATALCLAVLYPAVMLASGLMDRRLAGHPRLYFLLSVTQLTTPLLAMLSVWPALAFIHLVLLGILGYGLRLFARDWLRLIFVERHKSAWYAAGTLVYAALASFVHTRWGAGDEIALPAGYYGPFLMALCGLLFYVDAHFKRWTAKHAFLSRFSFLLYGLSVVALAIPIEAPPARAITLVLAIGIYGLVVWNYLTLTPLYLLLASSFWLYAAVLLQPFPAGLHLLLSLPGLLGLYALNSSVLARRSAQLGEISFRVLAGAVLGLTAWSLWTAQPGLIACLSAGVGTGLVYALLGVRPANARDHASGRREGAALYCVTLLCAVTLAYVPLWFGLEWSTQFCFGLLILATAWTRHGRGLSQGRNVTSARIEVLFNSALLALGAAVAIMAMTWILAINPASILALVLLSAGALLLWLSLGLYVRGPFYAMLVLWASAGIVFKLHYFPEPSNGGIMMLLAVVLWFLLCWMERGPDAIIGMRPERSWVHLPVTLLWRFRIAGQRDGENHE